MKFRAINLCLLLFLTSQFSFAQQTEEKPLVIIKDKNGDKVEIKVGEGPNKAFMGIHVDSNDEGVFILKVEEDGPAEKGGLQEGDFIIQIDDKEILSLKKLLYSLAEYVPGDEIEVEFEREDELSKTRLSLGDKSIFESKVEEEIEAVDEKEDELAMMKQSTKDERTLEERGKLGVSLFESSKLEGILISEVYKNSPADKKGLKEEDIIIACDEMKIHSRQDLAEALYDKRPGDMINLVILRNGN
ncbi:MAG: PDZ domain-containing protein, partial [Bacteroidota bacterium]